MKRMIPATEPFHAVRVTGPGRMRVTQAPRHSIVITIAHELAEYVEYAVVDQTLHIGLRTPRVVPLRKLRELVSYDITLPDLRALEVLGSALVEIPDLDTDELAIAVTGSGRVAMARVTADSMSCSISGSGRVAAGGDVETQQVTISGSGFYDALELVSDFAVVKVTGSGQSALMVNHELVATVMGSGQICYQGHPDIRPQILGSGTIRRLSGRSGGGLNHGVPGS